MEKMQPTQITVKPSYYEATTQHQNQLYINQQNHFNLKI